MGRENNAIQIALAQAGIGTSDSKSPEKVVAIAKNPQEILRAVQYAEEELHKLLLASADSESKSQLIQSVIVVARYIRIGRVSIELKNSIEQLFRTVCDLDRAATDLLSGAEAQIAELEAELTEATSKTEGIPLAIAPSEIDAELKRRQEPIESIRNIQEGLEDEAAEKDAELKTLKQQICAGDESQQTRTRIDVLESKLGALKATINSIIEARRVNDEKIEILIARKNAAKLLERGLPAGIIGEKIFDFK